MQRSSACWASPPRNADQPFPRAAWRGTAAGSERHVFAPRRCRTAAPRTIAGGWNGAQGIRPPAEPVGQRVLGTHEWLLAHCDNPEGFTFVQEVGISEHFEHARHAAFDCAAAPSSWRPRTFRLVLCSGCGPLVGRNGPRRPRVPEGVADSSLRLRSIDATWNGAWASCGPMRRSYSGHPRPEADRQPAEADRGGGARGQASEAPLNRRCPRTVPPASSGLPARKALVRHLTHRSESVIVALQTRDIWPEEPTY